MLRAGPRRGVVFRHCVVERPHLVCGADVGPLLAGRRRRPERAWGLGDRAVVDGVGVQLGQPPGQFSPAVVLMSAAAASGARTDAGLTLCGDATPLLPETISLWTRRRPTSPRPGAFGPSWIPSGRLEVGAYRRGGQLRPSFVTPFDAA